jgi:L-serine kinase (ADP)
MLNVYFTTTGRPVILMPMTLVRPHENHNPDHAADLCASMLAEGVFTHPICLESKSLTILDGHHRFRAAETLGFTYIPSVLVDYWADDVSVSGWREGETVTRELVLNAARLGQFLPIKTSRHTFLKPIGESNIPLDRIVKLASQNDWSSFALQVGIGFAPSKVRVAT